MSHADDVFRTSPKVPKGRLIYGHTKEFQTDTIGFLTDWPRNMGKSLNSVYDHSKMFITFFNPDLIKQILVTKQKSFVKSKDFEPGASNI
ncbi:hypothetical protein ACQKFG_04170 [Peribacillus sp. NPDC076916]|uniref:hypothetical protein n=1 Tax=Peribacillus sp. NPDC076916 TaxID=3390608 RepID=UPI003CFEDE8F